MSFLKVAVVTAVAAVIILAIESPAFGIDPPQGQAGIDVTPDGKSLETGLEDESPGGAGRARGGGTRIAFWQRTGVTSIPCFVDPERPSYDPESHGYRAFVALVDARTGQPITESSHAFCLVQNPGGADAGMPPEPPSVEEVVEAAGIPAPDIAVNPHLRGLTGLESWFWSADPETTVGVDVSLNGWTVTASLTASEWRWQIGDEGSYTADGPGSEDAPAVEHEFDVKGNHTITATTGWTGTWSLAYTFPDGETVTADVGGLVAETSSSLDYEVIESVGVLVPDE